MYKNASYCLLKDLFAEPHFLTLVKIDRKLNARPARHMTEATAAENLSDQQISPSTSETVDESTGHVNSLSPKNRPIELVFGFVGPTGVNQDLVYSCLKQQLADVGYETHEISLSKIIEGYDGNSHQFPNEFERISGLMSLGDDIRRRREQPDIVALLGVIKIRSFRETITGSAAEPHISRRIAYVVRSFKRAEEVALFRDIYGKAFNLISIYASKSHRIDHLQRKLAPQVDSSGNVVRSKEELALHLMARDYNEEGEKLGQRVGKTFPLADYFVVAEYRPSLEKQLERLIRLIFGDPYISPSVDEQSMFFAQAAALRSLDLSRQVGASIVTHDGTILSTGCNEVPKAGGGLYWADDDGCSRDFECGEDANVRVKKELVVDALTRLREANLISFDESGKNTLESLTNSLLFGTPATLGDSKLFDVIEFGRAVHAEMSAITSAARFGLSLQGSRLFCTTFPCHICARHIVSAGIREVVFIEPYEKSRVSDLYQDSIVIEPQENKSHRVVFRSFYGVAPRRYIDFFQPVTKRKNSDGSIRQSDDYSKSPRIKRITFTYTAAEDAIIKETYLPPRAITKS